MHRYSVFKGSASIKETLSQSTQVEPKCSQNDDGKRLAHALEVASIPNVMGERSENMEGVGSEGGGWSGSTPWRMTGSAF